MTQKISPDVLSSAARMASTIRSLSACEIIRPHQLPDEPPPPNEPPPPEKPPPRPEEPEDPSPTGMTIARVTTSRRRTGCAYRGPRAWRSDHDHEEERT